MGKNNVNKNVNSLHKIDGRGDTEDCRYLHTLPLLFNFGNINKLNT